MDLDSNKINEKMEEIWPQLRRLLVLQVKLYVDAFRDIFLSAVSLGAFLIDVVLGNSGSDCYFEKVLNFGRKTERSINLFNQFDPEHQASNTVDGVINDLEEKIRG
jgi:hypothetical protein